MIHLDRIKIVIPVQPEINIREAIVNEAIMTYIPSMREWVYRHEEYNLTITILEKDYLNKRSRILLPRGIAFEFTSKILGERMTELISCDNICDCLYIIHSMNIVRFDVNEVLANGEVVLLHVTQDKPVTTEFADNLTNFTAWNIDNNRKFTFVRYEGGFTLDKHGKYNDKRTHQRMTFYNKESELIYPSERVQSYFHGVYRVERELDSKEKIRKALHLGKGRITLEDVFRSKGNVFLDFYAECVNLDGVPLPLTGGVEDKIRMKLKDCGFKFNHPETCDDSKVLARVESWLRHRKNPRTGKKMVYAARLLRPYQQYLQRLRLKDAPTITREDIVEFFDTSDYLP